MKVIDRVNNQFDNILVSFEKRFGLIKLSGLVALILLAINLFTTKLGTSCHYLGFYYSSIAQNPFAISPDNPVTYRILTPFISYLLGLRGDSIIITNLIITFFFIGTVFYFYRNQLQHIRKALLVTFAITLTLVTSTSIHCGGYTDILTYYIIFLMWMNKDKEWIFFILFGLGLFNRESIIFLLPWFLLVYITEHKLNIKTIFQISISLIISFGLFYLFRQLVGSSDSSQYSLSYYLDPILKYPFYLFNITKAYHPLGLFSVFRFLWIVPIIGCIYYWKNHQKKKMLIILLIIALAYIQLFIAKDTSRMLTLSFMVLLLPIKDLIMTNYLNFNRWFPVLTLLNLITPQVYTAGQIIEVWHSLIFRIIYNTI